MKRNRSKVSTGRNHQGLSNEQRIIDQLIAQRRFDEARRTCEQLLTRTPGNAFLLHRMGIVLINLKDYEAAIPTLQRAVRVAPKDARIHNDLGIAQEKALDFTAAQHSYETALTLAPAMAEAHSNLADLFYKMECPVEAIHHATLATQLAPSNPLSWVALGETLQMQGKNAEAISAFEKAVGFPPPQSKAFCSLARAYARFDRKDEAISVLERARSLLGDEPRILNDLGLTLGSMKRYEEAQKFFEKAYRGLKEPAILFNVLTNLGFMKKVDEVFALADEVLRHPQPNVALSPLFSRASEVCQWDLQERLLPYFLEWCAIDDRKLTAAGHSLLSLLPIPAITPERVRGISERVTGTYRKHVQHYQLDFDYSKAMESYPKLRIGYLSGDFMMHVVNYFVSGQFSNYDKQYFEVYCYSNLDTDREDEITDQYRGAVDRFVRIAAMDDGELARRIAADGIHMLIDLSGYTGETRLSVMFHRPAPVQLTYLGYPFTTGLKEVDYVLSDPWLNGPDNAAGFTEQILEIQHSFISLSDLPALPENPEPPLVRNGYVTFGSLNNSYKLNRQTVVAWSRILLQVPHSRIVLNHPNYAMAATQHNIIKEFERNGVSADRVSIVTARHPKGWHLYWYDDIDIALDSFPQTGGTTTTEACWMGVPVVTLVGRVHYERLSYSILKNCDTEVDDLIAFDIEDYIERAVSLARNRERVVELHARLPGNTRASLLCDPARQVRYYEDALIEGWNRKFSQQPKFTAETFSYARLASPATPLVATVADPGNLYHYVVDESGRWFAPEYLLLQKLAGCLDGLAVEIGSEPGFFSLELAHAGMRTLSLCTSTVAGRQIRAAADKGGVGERVEVRLESARTCLLDRAELVGVALLRIGVEANDGQAGVLARNPAFWTNNTPVVLLSVHDGNASDLSVARGLAAMGYGLFRLVPGLGCFEPFCLGDNLDDYTLHLLACSGARQADLVRAGVLVTAATRPKGRDVDALAAESQASDPQQQMDGWIIRCANCAYQADRDMGERLGYLQLALEAQQARVDGVPSLTRRLTLARLLSDAGNRAAAVAQLNCALEEIQQGIAQVTLPFLAPSVEWGDIGAGERLAEWLLAATLETRFRLAAHSTFFLGSGDVDTLGMLAVIGFETDFSRGARRAHLARQVGCEGS